MFSVPFTTSYVYTTTPASIVTATPIITPVVTQTPVYIPVLVQEKPAEKKPDPPKKDPPPPPPPKPLPQPEYHSHNVTHIQISTNSSGFHTTHTSDVTPLRNDSGHTMFYHNGKDTKSIPPGGLIPHWSEIKQVHVGGNVEGWKPYTPSEDVKRRQLHMACGAHCTA